MKILSGYVMGYLIILIVFAVLFSFGRILFEDVNKSVFNCIFVVKIV